LGFPRRRKGEKKGTGEILATTFTRIQHKKRRARACRKEDEDGPPRRAPKKPGGRGGRKKAEKEKGANRHLGLEGKKRGGEASLPKEEKGLPIRHPAEGKEAGCDIKEGKEGGGGVRLSFPLHSRERRRKQ